MDQLKIKVPTLVTENGKRSLGKRLILTVSRVSSYWSSNSWITLSTVGRLSPSVITFNSIAARHRPRWPTSDLKNFRNLVNKCPRSIFVTDIQTLTLGSASTGAAAARFVDDILLDPMSTAVFGFEHNITSIVNTVIDTMILT